MIETIGTRLATRLVAGLIIALAGLWIGHASAQQVPFLPLDQSFGLPTQEILCLHQTRSGVMLAGSDQGVFAFDGERFFSLGPAQGLPDGGSVIDLGSTSDGRVVVRFTTDLYLSDSGLADGMSPRRLHFSRAVSAIGALFNDAPEQMAPWGPGMAVIEKGRLALLAGHAGAARVTDQVPGLAVPASIDGHFISVFDQGDVLWAGLDDGRLCRLQARSPRCLGTADGVPRDAWRSFATDGPDLLLARSAGSLVMISLTAGTVAVAVDHLSEGGRDHLLHLAQDFPRLAVTAGGRILTSDNSGLAAKDSAGWRPIVPSFDTHGRQFDAILLDQAGNLWVSSYSLGVFEARNFGVWENWTRADGLSSDSAWQFAQTPGGPVWVTTDSGLDEIDRSSGRPMIRRAGNGASYAVAATDSDGVWRSLGNGGLSRLDTATRKTTTFDTPLVNVILRGGTRLWVGGQEGLTEVVPRLPTAAWPPAGISTTIEAACIGDDGTIWALSKGQLLSRAADGTVRVVVQDWHRPGFAPYAVATAGSGIVWVGGSGGGVFQVTTQGDRPARVTAIDTGQPSQPVFSILADRRGWTWVGSDRGISLFDGRRWIGADSSSGLIGNDSSQSGLFEDEDGSIWIATSEGVSHVLDPAALVRAPVLRPLISLVRVGNVAYVDRAIGYSSLPLVIQFGALGARSDIRFRYRLKGVDATWADTGFGAARYPFLPYGHHAFTVIAYDPLTHEESPPATIVLRMRPPLWLYWPLDLAYIVGISALVLSLWRLRYRYLLAQSRKLQREVDRRTRELQAAQAALILQATRDSLTGLLTRGEIQRRLVEALLTDGPAPPLVIGLLDIDFFKRINDEVGHLAGDEILEEIGRRLNRSFLAGEEAGRYGGEEILIVLRGASTSNMLRMHELKFAACQEPFAAAEARLCVTCSIGVARARDEDTWKSLIGRADKALYRAKAEGRDRVIEADVAEPRRASR